MSASFAQRNAGRVIVTVIMTRGVLAAVAVLLGMGVAAAQPATQSGEPAGIAYDVEIAGVEGELGDFFRQLSVLVQQRASPPRSYGALRSRIDEDIATFRRVLRSRGYYDADITQRVDTAADPIQVEMRVFAGPQYTLETIDIAFIGPVPEPEIVDALRMRLGLSPGDAAVAGDILAAEATLMAQLPQLGHPLAVKGERRVVVAHARRAVQAIYRIDAGPAVRFGPVRYEGAEEVERSYLERLRPWEGGDVFDRRKLERFRRELVSTRLFSQVRIDFAEPEESLRRAEGPISPEILIDLRIAPLRTISIGAGFSTSEGIGAEVSWEHRNLFGADERLTLTARGASIEQSLTAAFRKPNFRRRGQVLTAGTGFVREDTDAFDSIEYNASLGFERELSDIWRLTANTELVATEIDDREGERTFLIGSLAMGIGRDTRNDILDPTHGSYLRLSATPHLAEQNNVFTFFKNEFEASAYQRLDADADVVLAERVKLGSISGARRQRLPASRRFFSGGGGSNRGFDFQEAGPLDADGDPIGGRSIFEATLETRIRVARNFGVVPFVDVSRVWEDQLPQFDNLRWGTGIGFRYFTGFAPIRVDIAFPVNKRSTDDSVQFFISLGQSF